MRSSDSERLKMPFPATTSPDIAFCDALDLVCPNLRELSSEIRDDLDPVHYGIGWWSSGSLDLQRRILISDYLVAVVSAIQTNLIEARLHLMEAEDAWSLQNEQLRAQWKATGSPIPEPKSAFDQLPNHLGQLHAAGVVRALASAIDCLAGVIIGVGGLRLNIVRADWQQLEGHGIRGTSPGEVEQQSLLDYVSNSALTSGPSGWLDWMLDLRNMLTHRGRRFVMWNIRPISSGKLTIAVEHQAHAYVSDYLLPSEPGKTDVDVWRGGALATALLNEPAQVTLSHALSSAIQLIENVSTQLTTMWKNRRSNPSLIHQPLEQWKTILPPSVQTFAGFEPGTSKVDPGAITANEDLVGRLNSSGITGNSLKRVWP